MPLANFLKSFLQLTTGFAQGAYKAIKEAGLRIPKDIGIFGYGFSEITDFFNPQLTVINQDPRKMGMEAVNLLINEIEKKNKKRTGKNIYRRRIPLEKNQLKEKQKIKYDLGRS